MGARRKLTQAQVEKLALALPETRRAEHHGTPDFRVGKRIFATIPTDKPSLANLKSTAVNLDALVLRDPETFRDVWAGKWIGVNLERVDPAEFRELLTEAWRLTAPKKLVRQFDEANGT